MRLGALLVALSAACFGAMPIFAVWAYDDGTSTWALLLVRFSVAAVVLLAAVAGQRLRRPDGRRVAALAAMGGVGYVTQAFCYFTALHHASAGLVALLLYLFPAFVAVLAAVFLGERLTRPVVLALAVVLLGTGLVVGGGSGQPLGIALGIASAVVYATYITVGTVVTRGLHPMVVTTVVCAAAATTSGLVVLGQTVAGAPPSFPQSGEGWAALLAVALVSTVVAILAFFAGLQRLGATKTSVLSTLEPVVTVTLAAVLLSETLTGVQLVGGALVLGAVVWQALAHRPVAQVEEPPV